MILRPMLCVVSTVGDELLWRLSRLAASDGGDTDTSAVVLVEFDIHYRSVRHGRSI